MSQTAKNIQGQGAPDFLEDPKGPGKFLSKSFRLRLVRAIWPTQNITTFGGIVVVRGDKEIRIGTTKALAAEISAEVGGGIGSGATGSISLVQMFRVKSVQGDYLTCRTWDGTTDGAADVYVAKPYLLRNSLTSRGSIQFTYTTTQQRTAMLAGQVEIQMVTPAYDVNDLIWAAQCATAVVLPGTQTAVSWQEISGERVWARCFTL
jgi:hypothetical protein